MQKQRRDLYQKNKLPFDVSSSRTDGRNLSGSVSDTFRLVCTACQERGVENKYTVSEGESRKKQAVCNILGRHFNDTLFETPCPR
jgi:hypothetical protein